MRTCRYDIAADEVVQVSFDSPSGSDTSEGSQGDSCDTSYTSDTSSDTDQSDLDSESSDHDSVSPTSCATSSRQNVTAHGEPDQRPRRFPGEHQLRSFGLQTSSQGQNDPL